MIITINNTEFDMYSYYATEHGVSLKLTDTSINAIETAVGDGATVEIGQDYKGYDMELSSITKEYDKESEMYRVVLHEASLDKAVAQNTADIETNSEAIIELAELIG